MASSQAAVKHDASLLARLDEARRRTDELFKLLPPNSFYDRPIAERHRMIFYLGHLEAFDWNLLGSKLGLPAKNQDYNRLFAFGIDPVEGGLPSDTPADWPTIAEVEKYNRGIRAQLDEALADPTALQTADPEYGDALLHVAIEHRLMHAETLAYLLHNLAVDRKIPHPNPPHDTAAAPQQRQVTIPEGIATLGQARNTDNFGWDNEFEIERHEVPSFSIGVFPVTNGEYLKFVQAGGYQDSRYWKAEDWEWKRQLNLDHPHFWLPQSVLAASDPDLKWNYQGMFGTVPMPFSWPVYVSHAEASAFAKWTGKQLPTEEQWQRAAYGTPHGTERQYPWGNDAPTPAHGNFHHERWDPTSVDAYAKGASAFGVFDLLGNGWEWTRTPFAPLNGFEPFPFYLGYSANFFDGKHYVIKGGSMRTDACMLRRPFRNWFQPHYPYIYTTFRCVEE